MSEFGGRVIRRHKRRSDDGIAVDTYQLDDLWSHITMNTRRWCLVPLVCAVISLAVAPALCPAAPSVTGMESVKLLHKAQEAIVLHAKVAGAHEASTVELWAQSGVEQPERVLARPLAEVLNGETLTVVWLPNARKFGLALTLRLLGKDGSVMATAGPVVVEVADDWGAMVRMTTIHAWRHLAPDLPEKEITEFLDRQKRDHVNVVEIYEFKSNCGGLTPPPLRRYELTHPAYKSYESWLSAATVKKWIEEGKRRGIRMIGYCNMMTAPESVFRRTDRVYARVQGKLEPVRNPWYKEFDWYVPDSRRFGKVFGEDLAGSVREYGWDGWFLDSVGGLFGDNTTGLDAEGKPLSSLWEPGDWQGDSYHEAWDQKADEFLGDLNSELRRQGVSPVLVCNAMAEAMWRGVGGAYWKRLENVYSPFRTKGEQRDGREVFLGARASRHQPVWFAEYPLDEVQARKAPWNYWQVAACMRSVRDAAGSPLIYHLHLATPDSAPQAYSPQTLKPLLATILANGLGVSAITQPKGYQPREDSEANLAIRQYYGFAARYGTYLYDRDWLRMPTDAVKVEAPENVFWRELAFRKTRESDTRECVLHLIHLSGPPKTTTIVGPHLRLAAMVDVPVAVRWDERSEPAVWCISADGDQNPSPVPVERKGGFVRFTVPRLDFWTMVVVKTTGNR